MASTTTIPTHHAKGSIVDPRLSADHPIREVWAFRLRAERRKQRMTQRQLAEKVGWDHPWHVALLETAKPVSAEKRLRIADALGIPADVLFPIPEAPK